MGVMAGGIVRDLLEFVVKRREAYVYAQSYSAAVNTRRGADEWNAKYAAVWEQYAAGKRRGPWIRA
ncbi:MAG: hypothetical protein EBR82_73175 [Caulobacteraceae bacterium]|nr:hypothetical protein [Caulobacteraceae bacterium]